MGSLKHQRYSSGELYAKLAETQDCISEGKTETAQFHKQITIRVNAIECLVVARQEQEAEYAARRRGIEIGVTLCTVGAGIFTLAFLLYAFIRPNDDTGIWVLLGFSLLAILLGLVSLSYGAWRLAGYSTRDNAPTKPGVHRKDDDHETELDAPPLRRKEGVSTQAGSQVLHETPPSWFEQWWNMEKERRTKRETRQTGVTIFMIGIGVLAIGITMAALENMNELQVAQVIMWGIATMCIGIFVMLISKWVVPSN